MEILGLTFKTASDDLPEYYDRRKCPKCGQSATTSYVAGLIRRDCVRCGYSWRERPLDAKRANVPEGNRP